MPREVGGRRPSSEVRFPVMSTEAHVLVVGGTPGLAHDARDRIIELERRWTRFHPSEITALNARAGEPVDVSLDTLQLVEACVTAWEATDGRFDPSVLASMVASGYDRSIDELDPDDVRPPAQTDGSPGLAGVFVWPELQRVMLPAGVGIDPGGIGKGLAADLVVDELLEAGAAGALVNLGGDCRVGGQPPEGDRWTVSVTDPWKADVEFARVALEGGGVATSSRLRRRWTRGGRELHHLIDPRTGEPVSTDVISATVVAGLAWWAEACTKSLMVAGAERGLSSLSEASAIVVLADGSWQATPDLMTAVVRERHD
jgi:thiamine biosynthesis lipoprotein